MNRLFFILVLLTLVSCGRSETLKHGDKNILPFELIVYDSDYSMAYSLQYVLTEIDLKVIFNGGLKDAKDSTLFETDLERNESLDKLSRINLGSLQENYRNPCVEDGSQITVKLSKNDKTKEIHLSNYYQQDIGFAIELINSLTPSKYKIWYDKVKLLESQKNCK